MATEEASAELGRRVGEVERWTERLQIYVGVGKWIAGILGVTTAGALAYLFSSLREVEAKSKVARDEVSEALVKARAQLAGDVQSAVGTATSTLDERARSLGMIAVPVGTVVAYGGPLDPSEVEDAVRKQHVAQMRAELEKDGWLPCDGSDRQAAEFPRLWAVLNGVDPEAFAAGRPAPAVSFALPDYRGQFLRGLDVAGAIDLGLAERKKGAAPSRAVGSSQTAALAGHRHKLGEQSADRVKQKSEENEPLDYDLVGEQRFFGENGQIQAFVVNGRQVKQLEKGSDKDDDFKVFTMAGAMFTDYAVGSPTKVEGETRPTNVAVHYLIKAR